MSAKDFNQLVELAMEKPGLAVMRPVVEKEILHYDIFQALDNAGLLRDLVFQGGTSLRLCRGSQRFSEDLDFAGGRDFTSAKMAKIKECIEIHIGNRYGLNVEVTEKLHRETDNVKVDKWRISVETAPGNRAMPRQKIKLEIANIPAYTNELMPLRANYDFFEDYNRVLVATETISEVMADKVLAFPAALAKNIRHRDIWDLAWLTQQGAALDPEMVMKKVNDYGIAEYDSQLDNAISRLPGIVQSQAFKDQMRRFLDAETFEKRLGDSRFLDYLTSTVGGIFNNMKSYLSPASTPSLADFKI